MDTDRDHPLITIIVPVYNVEAYLDRCVQSLADQTYAHLEILLVDDGSPDGCPAMCDAWAANDERIKVIHKENGGPSDARNAGLEAAHGEYISFVDSDDWVSPDFIESLYHACILCAAEISCCSVLPIWDGQAEPADDANPGIITLSSAQAIRMTVCRTGIDVYACNKLFKKSVLNGLSFEKDLWHEDILFSYHAISRVERVAYIEDDLYYYCQSRQNSILRSRFTIKRLDAIAARVMRLRLIESEFPEISFLAKQELITKCCYNAKKAWWFLPAGEKRRAFLYMSHVLSRTKLFFEEWRRLKFSHKVWVTLSGMFKWLLAGFDSYG